MEILTCNTGSSTAKLALFDIAATQNAEPRISVLWTETEDLSEPTARAAENGVGRILKKHRFNALAGVSHRVVHGGDLRESVRITPEIKATITQLSPFAPLHNPLALAGITAIEKMLGADIAQFASFDTAFHASLSPAAFTYPGPQSWAAEGIRRYGFHGINHRSVTRRAAQLLAQPYDKLKIISCHLGNGCSLAAVKNGSCIDTTMGFTPLEGLMMGTRSGSVDPGILLYLLREKGLAPAELDRILTYESGLKGLSGISSDFREVSQAAEAGNAQARLALDVFLHRLNREFGSMLASLGGVDAIVFTGGIGENAAAVRTSFGKAFSFLGLAIDPAANSATDPERIISTKDSAIAALVIKSDEAKELAVESWRLLAR